MEKNNKIIIEKYIMEKLLKKDVLEVQSDNGNIAYLDENLVICGFQKK